MQKIREMVRLGILLSLSDRQVARSVGASRPTVASYLARLESTGKTAQELLALSDDELLLLVKEGEPGRPLKTKVLPEWQEVRQELGKKSVTLQLLWQEYIQDHPDGYRLSQFCELYRCWKKGLAISMRQDHKAAEKLFVDFAGQTIPVHDPFTGGIIQAQIFVATLGFSSKSYAEAVPDQTLQNWIMGQVHAFEFFGGVTEIVVPDNPKALVSKACFYDPDLNPAYLEMASHYGVAIVPARVRHPKDKAKVESAVGLVERWILASLRNRKFFSFEELNAAIREKLEYLNNHPFQKLEGSREELFDRHERQALKPLPANRYLFAFWNKTTVNIDYHIEANKRYYSVPHQHRGQKVDVRYNASTVEVFLRRKRIASHLIDPKLGKYQTVKEHMPQSHREYLEWPPSRIENWASSVGPSTGEVVKKIIQSKTFPVQGYRASLGVISLGRRFSNERLEKACQRALSIGAHNYQSVRSILEKGLDRQMPRILESLCQVRHENIRGSAYYTPAKEVVQEQNNQEPQAV
ncbi:MAG: IS21 family transposase [Candidatus Omnitrophota bacterium]